MSQMVLAPITVFPLDAIDRDLESSIISAAAQGTYDQLFINRILKEKNDYFKLHIRLTLALLDPITTSGLRNFGNGTIPQFKSCADCGKPPGCDCAGSSTVASFTPIDGFYSFESLGVEFLDSNMSPITIPHIEIKTMINKTTSLTSCMELSDGLNNSTTDNLVYYPLLGQTGSISKIRFNNLPIYFDNRPGSRVFNINW